MCSSDLSHDLFLAKVVSVTVEDALMDKTGRFHLNHSGLLAYSHGSYFELGSQVGAFGYSVRKKSTNRKKKKSNKA